MKKTAFFAFLAMMAAVCPAFAELKVATVNMEKIITAHPKTDANKAELLKLQKSYEAEREIKRNKVKGMVAELNDLVKESENEALSDKVRKQKLEEARDLDMEIRKADQELRKTVSDLQEQLRDREFELFGKVMDEVAAAIEEIAKAEKYDIVLDRAGMSIGAPIPIVMYSAPSLDISDKVIEKVGGGKKAAAPAEAGAAGK